MANADGITARKFLSTDKKCDRGEEEAYFRKYALCEDARTDAVINLHLVALENTCQEFLDHFIPTTKMGWLWMGIYIFLAVLVFFVLFISVLLGVIVYLICIKQKNGGSP